MPWLLQVGLLQGQNIGNKSTQPTEQDRGEPTSHANKVIFHGQNKKKECFPKKGSKNEQTKKGSKK